jgi:hypothetical protein
MGLTILLNGPFLNYSSILSVIIYCIQLTSIVQLGRSIINKHSILSISILTQTIKLLIQKDFLEWDS